MKSEWYVSCKIFTCWVKTDDSSGETIIIEAAPIIHKWIGQSFYKMVNHYKVDGMSPIKNEL